MRLFLETTILSLFGRALPIESNVFLPMITVFLFYPEHVIFLNILRSGGKCQGSLPLSPIPKLAERATTRSNGIEFIFKRELTV